MFSIITLYVITQAEYIINNIMKSILLTVSITYIIMYKHHIMCI